MQNIVNMKTIKYTLAVVAAIFAFGSCQKHVVTFDYTPIEDLEKTAQFEITYVEPVANVAANYIDVVELNGVQIASTKGGNTLTPYGTIPNGGSSATGRFFIAKPGVNNIKFYRISGENKNLVYDKDVTLEAKKQNLFVYDLTKDPIIMDNLYPYPKNTENANAATFDTDSVATIRFINFAYKGNSSTPYPGKIQYQWCHDKSKGVEGRGGADGNWQNIGEAVGFGEATGREAVIVWKEKFNSGGSEQLWFRGVDAESGSVIISNDYWTTNIGTQMNHLYRGIKGGSPSAGITLFGSLR